MVRRGPNNFLDARLIARSRALDAARDAALEGEDDSVGALGCGGGGNVVLLGSLLRDIRLWKEMAVPCDLAMAAGVQH